jgi:Smg protein
VYAGFESEHLGPDAVGFLAFLEAAGQLTAAQREIVIERALALRDAPVPLARLKVIVLMVLWCQQADIDVLVLEELLDDGEDRRHQ